MRRRRTVSNFPIFVTVEYDYEEGSKREGEWTATILVWGIKIRSTPQATGNLAFRDALKQLFDAGPLLEY